jgi:hypothetical protein
VLGKRLKKFEPAFLGTGWLISGEIVSRGRDVWGERDVEVITHLNLRDFS